jgi:tetratricopeptide (TPR) repeat protein
LANLREALSLAVQLHDVQAEAQILGRISAVQAEQGMAQEAIETASRALSQAKESGDERLLGEQQMLLAFAYHDAEDRARAAAHARSALQAFETLGDTALIQRAQALLAMVA